MQLNQLRHVALENIQAGSEEGSKNKAYLNERIAEIEEQSKQLVGTHV